MPFRKLNKSYRLYRVAQVLLIAHHILCILIGVSGFVFIPSPTIERAVGSPFVDWIWSAIFVLFGSFALYARIKHKPNAENWAIGSIAVSRGIWATTIIVSVLQREMYGGLQIGLALLASTLFMLSWSSFTFVWVKSGLISMQQQETHPDDLIEERMVETIRTVLEEETQKQRVEAQEREV